MTEFLPLCDVLFNVISLAGYFCSVVFDVVLGYALLERGLILYFTIVICFVVSSLIISQIVSLRWYWNNMNTKKNLNEEKKIESIVTASTVVTCDKNVKICRYTVVVLHFLQLGVLWRYAKLFTPVDLRRVKHEVRDLCMLRLVHAFCVSAPMLLLQLYLLITIQNDSKFLSNIPELKLKNLNGQSFTGVIQQHSTEQHQHADKTFKDLNIVSATLSLFSVCWALASFSKNVRFRYVHRLVLTWLGVIFQFIWRLGTVISRIASLTVYAYFYKYWVFLVIILHWLSMFLWLISPKNVFHGEKISRLRKTLLSGLIAFVYVFAYINLQEVNHRQKMFTFYIVMFLENLLLVCLWLVGVWPDKPDRWYLIPILVFGSFIIGIVFMIFYYKYFHVRRLNWESGSRYLVNETGNRCGKINLDLNNQPQIAGVFNCRFTNPVANVTRRKKKKPSTFIPHSTIGYSTPIKIENICGPMEIPFWKRPLPISSENESSSINSSRVNIHQKLQEKKLKQLAELKIIEEEIKQGKLGGPDIQTGCGGGDSDGRTSLRQPIPRAKKHINIDQMSDGWCHSGLNNKSINDIDELNNLNKFSTQYDQIYTNFGSINIPNLESTNIQNLSTPSSQQQQIGSINETSLTRKIHHGRSKIPHNISSRDPFSVMQTQSRNISSSPVRNSVFDHFNHPRQISGTYSSAENPNPGTERLPFPYNVVPPPRSKLDSRAQPTTPFALLQEQQQQQNKRPKLNRIQQNKNSEVDSRLLLAPHYLVDNSQIYYDWVNSGTTDRNQGGGNLSSDDENLDISGIDPSLFIRNNKSRMRVPSDIDSQISLPRSYTLPREFKYYRRSKRQNFIVSTNSSDGDVDSCDDNETELFFQKNITNRVNNATTEKNDIKTINSIQQNFDLISDNHSRRLRTCVVGGKHRRHETKL